MEERWLSLLIWSPGSGWGLRSKKLTLFDVAGGDPPWCGFLRCNSNCQLGHLKWWESLRNMISQNLSPEISAYELTIPRASDWPSAGCICRIWRTRRIGADHEWLAAATFLGYFLSCEISLLGVWFFTSSRQQFCSFFSLSASWKSHPRGQCASVPSEVLTPDVNGAQRIYLENAWLFINLRN